MTRNRSRHVKEDDCLQSGRDVMLLVVIMEGFELPSPLQGSLSALTAGPVKRRKWLRSRRHLGEKCLSAFQLQKLTKIIYVC